MTKGEAMAATCGRCNGSGSESVRYWNDREGCYAAESVDCGECYGAGVSYWHEDAEHDRARLAREDADAAAWDAFDSWGQ